MARPDRLVIGVEQIGERRVESAIYRIERAKQKRLEKPAGVRQMPLRRADVRHRLDRLVLGREVGGEGFGLLADRGEAVALDGAVSNARRWRGGNVEHLAFPRWRRFPLNASLPALSRRHAARQLR